MRSITRAALIGAAALPLAMAAPSLASASTAADVTFAYSASDSTVSNTITNNSGGALQCSTSLGNAPSGVLPPIEVTIGPGQTIYESGVIPTGTTVQTINDIPYGSYVVLASCSSVDEPTSMWVSDYPGLEPYLAMFPYTTYAVQQASWVVSLPSAGAPTPAPGVNFGS
ncbi:hypothetical protein [Rhodococcus sp. IEGM 1318]|uniref:hypothetical protein n=1 Tax=Rhodococcus sp. IEGM 1318 TaxID=3082226 RepID=UPI002952C8D3|nr:hypothetical protein [Rhodococcus sp. IEGM 1318]MDV8004601.1 hypothetical protein [Rhodococcus sp. IEGM 1318]